MKMPDKNALARPEGVADPVEVVEIGPLELASPGTPLHEIEEPKEFVKFVKKVEAFVRTAPEYRAYMMYLASELHMDRCSFLPDAAPATAGKAVKLEMHHAVLTLFDVVTAVIGVRTMGKPPSYRVSPMAIADEVLLLHYENVVPLVPVSNTAHDLLHSGRLFVGVDQVFGDLRQFFARFGMGLTSKQKDQLAELVSESHQRVATGARQATPKALRRRISVLEVEDAESIRKINVTDKKGKATA
jgi:hypothetical protein